MAASSKHLSKAVKKKLLGKKDDTAIALTLRQLSDDSLSKLNSLLDSVDVLELEKEQKEKKEKNGDSKEEVFNARILPQIRYSANLYLSSVKSDDFSLDIQGYIIFSNKLRSGLLSTEPAEDLLGYTDKVETDTQRFLLMVIADKGYIFKHIRKEQGSNFQKRFNGVVIALKRLRITLTYVSCWRCIRLLWCVE